MVELLRTNDPVVISFAEALLTESEVTHQVVDRHMSMLEGSIGAVQIRLLVADNQLELARRLLADGGLHKHIQ